MNDWYETTATRLSHFPPKTIRPKPHWISQVQSQDRALAKLLDELYASLNIDLSILPAIGARTVFDCAAELLGVPQHYTFEKKLDELVILGKIGGDERRVLDVLVQAGNAAAHRGWSPRATDTSTMMDVAESFLKSNFYLRHEADQVGRNVPPKPPRPRPARPLAPGGSALPPPSGALSPPSGPASPPSPLPGDPEATSPSSPTPDAV